MPTDELLREALEVAQDLGCEVEQRWRGGEGGEVAWRRNRKRVVLDRSQSSGEQLQTLKFALRGETFLPHQSMRPELVEYLDVRRVA